MVSATAAPSSALRAALQRHGLQIRTVRPSDMDAVREIFAVGMRSYADQFREGSRMNQCVPRLPQALTGCTRGWLQYVEFSQQDDLSDQGVVRVYAATGGCFWVVCDSAGSLLGCVGAQRISQDVCELRRMSVDPKARRRGVGQLLIWWLEEWAVAGGFKQVVLSTASVMAQVRRGFDGGLLCLDSRTHMFV